MYINLCVTQVAQFVVPLLENCRNCGEMLDWCVKNEDNKIPEIWSVVALTNHNVVGIY